MRSYGEFEYWFAGVKVVRDSCCLSWRWAALLRSSGLWPGRSLDFSDLAEHGGFFPNGSRRASSRGSWPSIFSMVGAGIAHDRGGGIGRARCSAIVRATNSVMVPDPGLLCRLDPPAGRVILPWNSTKLGASPYVSAMEVMRSRLA